MTNACISNLFLLLLYVPGNLAGNKWRNYMAGPETDVGKTCKVETRAFVTSELSRAACAYRCNIHGNCAVMFYSPSTKICHGCLGEFGNLESDREQLPGSLPYSVCDYGSGWILFMDHCYFFGTEKMEYETAWDFCISNGGQIVYIESYEELRFLKAEMGKHGSSEYWNSLYQDNGNGHEKWMMMDGNRLEPTWEIRAIIYIAGARSVDWEGFACCPCAGGSGHCICIADTGDSMWTSENNIYRVREPDHLYDRTVTLDSKLMFRFQVLIKTYGHVYYWGVHDGNYYAHLQQQHRRTSRGGGLFRCQWAWLLHDQGGLLLVLSPGEPAYD